MYGAVWVRVDVMNVVFDLDELKAFAHASPSCRKPVGVGNPPEGETMSGARFPKTLLFSRIRSFIFLAGVGRKEDQKEVCARSRRMSLTVAFMARGGCNHDQY
jgi:hypothetical protein